jgi:hypothetical protein
MVIIMLPGISLLILTGKLPTYTVIKSSGVILTALHSKCNAVMQCCKEMEKLFKFGLAGVSNRVTRCLKNQFHYSKIGT